MCPVDIAMPLCPSTFLVGILVRPMGERTRIQVTKIIYQLHHATCNVPVYHIYVYIYIYMIISSTIMRVGTCCLTHRLTDKIGTFSALLFIAFQGPWFLDRAWVGCSHHALIPRFFAMEASNSFLSLTFQRVGGPRNCQKVGPGLDGPVMSCVGFIRNTYFETPIAR